MKRVALFVTYTMSAPVVGGAFFRALRLANELYGRGWSPIICNNGPMLVDPKINQAQGRIQFIRLEEEKQGLNTRVAYDFFESFDPTIIVFGESPFETMKVYFRAAQLVNCPLVLLDQFYAPWLIPEQELAADLVLLYGLRTFWKPEVRLPHDYIMIPPFIESVTPRYGLPIPARLHSRPWVTLIAYDMDVLRKGIALLACLKDGAEAIVSVCPQPAEAESRLEYIGIAFERRVSLPLQSDAHVFGLMRSSRVALISNGYLQIMEALALACPVICIDREGVGIAAWTVDERFKPYVSIGEEERQQQCRLQQWLREPPFGLQLRRDLEVERDGIRISADSVEKVTRGGSAPKLRRRAQAIWSRLRCATQ
jgi:hypothetical protein